MYSELFLNNTTLNPSPSPEKIIGVNFVEELDLTPSSFTTPSSIVSVYLFFSPPREFFKIKKKKKT